MLTGQQTLVNDACFVLECLEINVYGLWSVVLFRQIQIQIQMMIMMILGMENRVSIPQSKICFRISKKREI
jgi:hypothetical protein